MDGTVLRGLVLHRDGWSEGTVVVENGRITHCSDKIENGESGGKLFEGMIIPGFMDMHTHIGDSGARGDLPVSLEETVLPGGVKHRFLRGSTREVLISSLKASIEEVHPGVTFLLDYREGGLEGLQLLEEAVGPEGPMVAPLSRVVPGDDPENVLGRSMGFGIPSLNDAEIELRELAGSQDKLFSLHASESFREDMDRILELRADQVVHMVAGSGDDWVSLAGENIPVTVCPRSNSAYNIPVPLGSMLESGLRLTLGTDNSLSSMQDIFREMETAWLLLRKTGVRGSEASREVFGMAVGEPLQGTSLIEKLPPWRMWWDKDWPRKGDPSHLFVARRPGNDLWKRDPFTFIVRFLDRSQVLHTCSPAPQYLF
ncbi:MAG: hypothetical protein ACMUIE_08530 [Thermoplasmatota archaeon]